jgi:hypothetical protein
MRYVVRDNAIPIRLLRAIQADWPGNDWPGWHAYENGKRASRMVDNAPASIRRALEILAESAVLFTADSFPDLSFYGAGLHEIPAGIGLGWHKDAARHGLRAWRRTETAILYLDHGGDLVFRGGCNERISPLPGKSVVFLPGDDTEHCVEPSESRRRSLSVFFYAADPEAAGSVRAEFSCA